MAWSTANNWDVAGSNPANPPTSTDTAAFTGIQPGTVNVGASTTQVGTVSFSGASGAYNLSGGTLYLNQGAIQQTAAVTGTNTIASAITAGGSGILAVTVDGGQLNLSGNLTAAGGLVKNGAGTLVLGFANTYAATTTVNAGTLQLGITNALPNQPLVINGSTLDLGGYGDTITTLALNAGSISNSGAAATLTLGGDVASTGISSVGAGATLGIGTATRTLSVGTGVLTLSGGLSGTTGSLTKAGAGTLVLSNTSTYTGATTVSQGTLRVGTTNALASASVWTIASGAVLDMNNYAAAITANNTNKLGTGTVLLNGGSLTVTMNGGDATITAAIVGGPGSSMTFIHGTNTPTINASSYTFGVQGMVYTSAGYVTIGGPMPLTSWTPGNWFNTTGSAAAIDGLNVASGVNALGAITALMIGSNNGSGTYAGGTSGDTRSLTKVGTGTETLTSNMGGTTTWTIRGGQILVSGANGAMNAIGTTTIGANGALTLDNTSGGNSNTRYMDTAAVTINGGAFNYYGQTAAAGSTEAIGAMTFGAGNATINIASNNATGGAAVTAASYTRNAGATVDFNLTGVGAAMKFTAAPNTNGILTGATLGNDWATGGAGTGITALPAYDPWNGSGTTAGSNMGLTGSGTLGGALTINSLKISTSGGGQSLALGGNALTLPGGLLYVGSDAYSITGTGTLARSGSELILVDKGAGLLTISAPISGAGGGFTKGGSGTTLLTGTSTYTGATNVNLGTLQFGTPNAVSSSSALTVARAPRST